MTVATPVPPSIHENGLNGSVHAHAHGPLNPMTLPRFHPIAMNPNQSIPPEAAAMQNTHHFRPFPHPPPPPHGPVQDSGPPPPAGLHPAHIDHIEARLRQLEGEEAARMAARSQLLAIRKREDEDFRRMTESAEAEEEELRRQRKRIKRESMGLGMNASAMDSPPLRPTPPRRLSETNAATTLAFFKQQSPPDPRPAPTPPSHPHPHAHSHPHQHPHQHPPQPPQIHPHPHPHPHVQVHPAIPATAVPPPPHHPAPHDSSGGSIRKKQKYTIKNVEAWGERHGRPAAHDPSGRALWKRPSDSNLVYLTCPVPGCGKSDFVTLHGFMCHLTKKHKDRSLGSQSRALEVCGVVYDPNAPLPPTMQRASTEESRIESAPTDADGYAQEMEYSTGSDDDEGDQEPSSYPVKAEASDRPYPAAPSSSSVQQKSRTPQPEESAAVPKTNGSTKQSISSIIDRNPEEDEPMPPPPPETTRSVSQEQTTPIKEGSASQSDRESSESKETSDVKMETK